MENSRKRPAEDEPQVDKKIERETKAPAWRDEDDDMTDGKGVEGRKVLYQPKFGATYTNRLHDKFEIVYGKKPVWAEKGKPGVSTRNANRKRANDHMKVMNFSDGASDEQDKDHDEEESTEEDEEDFDEAAEGGVQGFSSQLLGRDFCTPLNESVRNEGSIIRAISFNPTTNIAIVAGDKRINLYRVDPANGNPWMSDFTMDGSEVSTAKWSYSGNELFVSSYENNRSFLYCNLETGDVQDSKPDRITKGDYIKAIVTDPSQRYIVALATQGRVHIFSEKTKEHIDTFHVGSSVNDAAFDSTGDKLYIQGGDSHGIYLYNMVTRTIIEAFDEFQNYTAEGLAMSQNYMVCGSVAGIVSVYETPKTKQKPKLLKEFKNLVTPTSSLVINNTEEILGAVSNFNENAFKLMNLKTMTVFHDTPNGLGRVNSLDFSPNSGYMAVGNNRGKAFLIRLKAYDKY